MKKSIILSFVFGTLFSTIQAQNNQNKYSEYYFKNFPNSPSTATFLRYGDIQNSEYTGTNSPQISLLMAESGTIKIPLILKYISGNGIKVAQEAGSVGLGWDINLPTITQSILGGYSDFDDLTKYLPVFTKSANPFNNYFPHSVQPLPGGFVSQPTNDAYSYYKTIDGFLPLNGNFTDLNNSAPFSVDTDTSPDIFTCNLFGEKLEFVINNYPTGITPHTFNPTFYCLNKKGYKISYNGNTYFTIIDTAGTKYYFSRVEDVRTLNSVSKNYVITKITDINNNDINFTYNEYSNVKNLVSVGQKLNYTYGNQNNHYSSMPLSNTQSFSGLGEFDDYYPGSSMNPLKSAQSVGFMTPPTISWSTTQNYLLINNISGSFGKVNFYYSDRLDFPTQKLDKIEEQNNINQVVKTVNFNYDYFNSQNSTTLSQPYQTYSQDRLTKRLKLLSVIINNDPYTFSYNETLLPAKNSTGVDYWGYSNGGFTNKTLFLNPNDFNYPTLIPVDNDYNNNFKQADINYTQSAVLNKIIYPTKGFSVFEYELNTANNLFYQYDYGKLSIGNGLRLASQTNKDFNNQFVGKTEFKYLNGISTNPLFLFNKNSYSTFEWRVGTSDNSAEGFSYSSGIISMNSNNNNSASPLSSGDYIGYSKVIRTEKDFQDSSKGSIETNYANTPDFHYFLQDGVIPISMPSTKSPNAVENGKVLNETIYDSSMNKIQQTDNAYSEVYSNVFYGTSLSRNSRYFWNGNGGFGGTWSIIQHGVTVLGYYPIFSKESMLSNSKTKSYYNGQELMSNTNLYYNSNNQTISKSITYPDGKYNAENTKYSTEKNNTKLINANVLSTPLEKQIIGNVINGSLKTTSLIETKFDDANHLNPTSVLSYKLSDINNNPSIEATYDRYDAKGNLLQYTTKDGIPVTIIWGYKTTQPIVKIEGGSYSQVMQAFGLDDSNNNAYQQLEIVGKSDLDIDDASEDILVSKLNEFRNKTEFKDFRITTYTYDPLIGIKSIIQPSGFKEVYKYDSSNRLENIKDNEGKIIKEFTYNYATTRYYSSLKSQVFTKNNCGTNAIPGTYNYTVPENTYISLVSQADADQQAQNEINTNGQNAANTNGSCTIISCSVTKGTGISQFNYGSIGLANTTNFRIQMGFVYQSNLAWSTGVVIGKIGGNCIPSGARTSSTYFNGIWMINIDTNGNITAQITSTSPSLVNNMNVALDFTFPIN
ncbi:hypothetical protein GCM10022217_06440 [Chryseobacterium ginsenosidimutans]|uniref:DUF5977 domain-containing protein n=1 Tax=Chryseobacterium ginsenosidimutans TaxID=687846 RepID=UPI0031E1FCCA